MIPDGKYIALPENYSALIGLTISGGNFKLLYGYGQTIYFDGEGIISYHSFDLIKFELTKSRGVLLLHEMKGHISSVSYSYNFVSFNVETDIVKAIFNYDIKLVFNYDPFPINLKLPYDRPKIFYRRITN